VLGVISSNGKDPHVYTFINPAKLRIPELIFILKD